MRKKLTQLLRIVLLMFGSLAVTQAKTQVKYAPYGESDFTFTIANDVQTSPKTMEFDICLLDTDPSQPFELAAVQAGILVNPGIYNSGTITVSFVAGTSQLNSGNVPVSVIWNQAQNAIKITPHTPPTSGDGTIISTTSPGTRVYRVKITNSVAFTTNSQANLSFNFPTSPYPTKVAQFINSINTQLTCNASNCFNNSANIVLNPLVTPVWTGDALTTDWATAGNWNPAAVPIVTDNVTIPNTTLKPVISGDVTISGLTIDLNAIVNVDHLATLTVTNTLTNNAGSVGLLVKSDATGTGSLIHNTPGITATVERYMDAYTDNDHGWHLLSSPVASFAVAGSPFAPGTKDDFYTWDEPTNMWLNHKVSPITFVPGTGYLVAYETTSTKTFTGALNAADIPITGLTNSTGLNHGWHLLGNPFACAINWATGNWTKTNMDAMAQVWDAATASYKTMTEKGNIIPAMNGFMVHTTGGGSITIPADARVHNAVNFYKSSDEEFILLKANDLEGSTSQSSIVRFNSQATVGYDSEFDSYFLSGYAPVFYSKSGDEYYALNTLPEVTESTAVSFGFVKNASSEFTLELGRSITGEILCLEDLKTGVIQNLTENPVYAFTSAEGDDPNRFVLHFLDPTGVNPGISSGIQIYAGNKTLYINQTDAQKGIITVYNTTGQLLRRLRLEASAGQSVNLQNFAPGIYVVAIQTGKGLYNQKVVVK